MYKNNPSLLDDFSRDFNNATRMGIAREDVVFEDLQKNGDIRQIAFNLYDKCSTHNIKQVEKDINKIASQGAIFKNGRRFASDRAYLEHMKHDKNMRLYVGDYAAGKLAELNKSALAQRLGQYKEVKQQQLSQEQQQKEQQKVKQLEMLRRM